MIINKVDAYFIIITPFSELGETKYLSSSITTVPVLVITAQKKKIRRVITYLCSSLCKQAQ